LAGGHARQVCRAACPRDDDVQPSSLGAFGILKQQIWGAVGADHAHLEGYLELFEQISSKLHGGQIGLATHDDANKGFHQGMVTLIEPFSTHQRILIRMAKYIVMVMVVSSLALASGLVGLPKDIVGFNNWAVVAKIKDTGGAHTGQNKQVFANKIAAAAWKKAGKLPVGSVVIKTGGKVSSPAFIAVMYKRSSGWYYEEYFPKGGRYSIGAGGKGGQALCKDCHLGGTDELFTR
jgi:hypothetical protein